MTTDKDITKKADEHPQLKNWVGYHCDMFQWGPTKNAVILRDMAIAYTAIAKSKPTQLHRIIDAENYIGSALMRVSEMLKLVSSGFEAIPPTIVHERADSWRTIPKTKGFKEHLVYRVVDAEEAKMIGALPREMVKLFRAVCKENINIRKAKLKIIPARTKGAYSPQEVVNWANAPYINEARTKWKQRIGKEMRNDMFN